MIEGHPHHRLVPLVDDRDPLAAALDPDQRQEPPDAGDLLQIVLEASRRQIAGELGRRREVRAVAAPAVETVPAHEAGPVQRIGQDRAGIAPETPVERVEIGARGGPGPLAAGPETLREPGDDPRGGVRRIEQIGLARHGSHRMVHRSAAPAGLPAEPFAVRAGAVDLSDPRWAW